MLIPLRWLSEYVDWNLSAADLAHRLSMAGAEVERLEQTGAAWDFVVVGRVAEVGPHPGADRLRLATVEYGADEPMTVVCGAPNLAQGQTIAFAQVGAELIDPQTREPRKLRRAKVRGVESRGMVCSERELGLSDEHEGILELSTEAPPGTPLAEVLGETMLDLKPTPNRSDHFSILGIAREVAALSGGSVREPELGYEELDTLAADRTSVTIEDPEGCPRYTAIVIEDATIGPSPDWMQQALTLAGMRPINNVVDVTNYVLLEWGQPLHAFDYDRLNEHRIVVRRARPDESIELLDGSHLVLLTDDLVIADADRAVALAGIMGGADAEVSEATTTVLLETATFDAGTIRRSAAQHKLRTEASLRFEKMLNPELAELAARRAARLIAETSGGRVCAGIVDEYPGKVHPPQVVVSQRRIEQILASQPSVETVRGLLGGLGIPNRWIPPDRFAVSCPPWRSDITIADDVVEEIGRIIGYDTLPSAALAGSVPEPEVDSERELSERVRDLLSGLGWREVITYAAIGADELAASAGIEADAPGGSIRMQNPMNSEQDRIRPSLRPGGLRAFAANQREARGALGLFEVGKTFQPRSGQLPREERMLLALLGGAADAGVHGDGRELDFYDLKGALELLGEGLGIDFEVAALDQSDLALAASESALVSARGKTLGRMGRVSQSVAAKFDLSGAVFMLELSLSDLASRLGRERRAESPSPFPAAVEDLALIVDEATPAGEIEQAIARQGLVEQVELFDIYRGAPVPDGRKSLAFRVIYRSPDRTLAERDVARARRGIVRRLESQFGAQLRDS